jgi:uncharacterized protein with FMN-binding domain
MTRIPSVTRLTPILLATVAALPLGRSFAAGAGTHTYKGSMVSTQYGPVQVAILVKKARIVDVRVAEATSTTRSAALDTAAAPVLRQEVLKAQSANVAVVSGATSFSQAYIQSLQTALKKAHR